MTREPGQLVFPANFERNIAAPLDAAQKVNTLSALTSPNTFRAINDGIDYSYVGMYTVVVGDSEQNNGFYILKQQPTTNIANWAKLQVNYSDQLTTNSKTIVDAINEVNEKTGISSSNISTPVSAGEPTFIQFSEDNPYLTVDNNIVADYEISLTFVSGDTIYKKNINFIANSKINPLAITHAEISDDEIINGSGVMFDADVEQVDSTNNITVGVTVNKEGIVLTSVSKHIYS